VSPPDDALADLLRDGWDELRHAYIEPVAAGMSEAAVYRVIQDRQPPRYLKIGRHDAAAALRDEIARTQWLALHGVRVPAVRRIDDQADRVVLLSQALPGVPADDSPLPVAALIDAIASAFAALHALPTADCPFDETLATRLARAKRAVEADEVDARHFADHNAGMAPAALLTRLVQSQPSEDLVVIHGDATLGNVLVDCNDHGGIDIGLVDCGLVDCGFVDCGNAGRGDRYVDLAIIADDIENCFGAEAAARFQQAYSRNAWDRAKAAYFLDLYELF
jgi:aminoglycoside phosphotransferase